MPSDPEILLWSATLKINEQPQIRGVLDVISDLTLEERRAVFAPNVGAQMATMFTETCHSIEAAKPSDVQDWNGVLTILGEFESLGNSEGAEALRWGAIRTRAMVLSDFMDQANEALTLLEKGLDETEGPFKYLLKFTQACILAARGEDDVAFGGFSEVLAINAEKVFPFYYSDGLRRGMIVASNTRNWHTARVWCLRLMREGTPESGVGPHDWTELLGELAWIHWSTGFRKKACGAMFGVVLRLLSDVQLDDPRYRETFLKVGHVTGWYAGVAQSGRPPDVTIDGQRYIDPYPGMLCLRAQTVPEVDDLSRDRYLRYFPSQIAMMASGVGILRMAVLGYRLAAERGRTQGYNVFGAAMDLERAPVEATLRNYRLAFEACISGSKSIPVMQKLGSGALDNLDDPELEWKQVAMEKKASIQSFHIFYMVLLPAFVSLIADGVDDAVGMADVGQIRSAIESFSESLVQKDKWERIARYMSFAFDPNISRQNIVDELRILEANEHHERMILHMALAHHSQRRPNDMYSTHSLLLTHLTIPQMVEKLTVRNVCRWIIRSWRYEVSTRAFRLNSPNFLRVEIEKIPEAAEEVSDAARVLLSAQVPAGGKLSDDLLDQLRELASRAGA